MSDRIASYEKALALFRERERDRIERHLAQNASAARAAALELTRTELEEIKVKELFEDHASALGFSSGNELGWHMVAKDEEQLRDWQMESLETSGDNNGIREDYLRSKRITRDRLGYGFRLYPR